MSNFHPLEVVGHGSETPLQMGKNLNKFIWQDKDKPLYQIIANMSNFIPLGVVGRGGSEN